MQITAPDGWSLRGAIHFDTHYDGFPTLVLRSQGPRESPGVVDGSRDTPRAQGSGPTPSHREGSPACPGSVLSGFTPALTWTNGVSAGRTADFAGSLGERTRGRQLMTPDDGAAGEVLGVSLKGWVSGTGPRRLLNLCARVCPLPKPMGLGNTPRARGLFQGHRGRGATEGRVSSPIPGFRREGDQGLWGSRAVALAAKDGGCAPWPGGRRKRPRTRPATWPFQF